MTSPQSTVHSPQSEATEGFFYCGHCNQVAVLPESVEANFYEHFKCPRCKKWTVTWRFPSPVGKGRKVVPRPVPAFSEFANGAFEAMRAVIDGGLQ